MNATSPTKVKRNLRIVRPTYPVTAVCECCSKSFMSRNENLDMASEHIRQQFERHSCDGKSSFKETIIET
jgi:hypothetical protein